MGEQTTKFEQCLIEMVCQAYHCGKVDSPAPYDGATARNLRTVYEAEQRRHDELYELHRLAVAKNGIYFKEITALRERVQAVEAKYRKMGLENGDDVCEWVCDDLRAALEGK
jgi:hypothetical protein